MKSQEQIQKYLDEVLADERLSYATANVFVNAPLALIQLELKTKANVLRWVLKESEDG
jgi:hypothetical protein